MKPKDVIERTRESHRRGWDQGFEAAKMDGLRLVLADAIRSNTQARVHPVVGALLLPLVEERMRVLGMDVRPFGEEDRKAIAAVLGKGGRDAS